MMRSPARVFFCLLGLLSTIGLPGCGGTETGNPTGPPGGREINPAYKLVEEVCIKLTSCFGGEDGFTQEDCLLAVQASDTLAAAFGIEEEPTPQYAQVIDKVEDNELSADAEALDACVDAIQSLTCDDQALQAVEIERGFSNVEAMIPEPYCAAVFSGP